MKARWHRWSMRRRRRRIITRRYGGTWQRPTLRTVAMPGAQCRNKIVREVAGGVLVTALFLALCTVLPIGAAIAVTVPLMGLLALAQVAEWREGRHA
jgi:hypothetical protein